MSVRFNKSKTFNFSKFSSNNLLFTKGIIVTDFLAIGGGGGGRNNPAGTAGCGGSGAGVCITSVSGESSGGGESNLPPFRFSANNLYTVTIGAGGAANSTGSNTFLGLLTANAGAFGQNPGSVGNGNGGGTESGANIRGFGSYGLFGYQYPGGNGFASATATLRAGGGGGGAGAAGLNGASGVGGNGGAGLASTITGSSVTRAGGGGGSCANTTTQGTGGSGGGGNAAFNGTAGSGTANTGSGGGAQSGSGTAGTGGTGIVFIKYPVQWNLTVGAGLTSSTTTSSGYKITSFTAGTDTISFS
jgi:hypothetical protein